jgi:hypothetical protein
MSLFQQKFSDATANLYDEVLIPSYMKPKIILLNKGFVSPLEDDPYFQPKFVNLLTMTIENQQVEAIVQGRQIMQMLFPNESEFVFNPELTIHRIVEALGIDKSIIETEKIRAEKRAAAQEQAIQLSKLAYAAKAQQDAAIHGKQMVMGE